MSYFEPLIKELLYESAHERAAGNSVNMAHQDSQKWADSHFKRADMLERAAEWLKEYPGTLL